MELNVKKYYLDTIADQSIETLEERFLELLNEEIGSKEELESWLKMESRLVNEVVEALNGHGLDFLRDTTNKAHKDTYLRDQSAIKPLLTKYQAAFDKKINECPFLDQLDESIYGLMKQVRTSNLSLFSGENITLEVKEQELIARYTEVMSSVIIKWDQEERSMSSIQALVDSPDRRLRERAWRELAMARKQVKPQVDDIMNELVKLRHQIAVNAGYENYRDYIFKQKNREYSIQDCEHFHQSAEQYLVPIWNELVLLFQSDLKVDSYRPWDMGPCTLQGNPFETYEELVDGVEQMLARTDSYFLEKYQYMKCSSLLDVEERRGKSSGAFCEVLPASKNAFILSNFSPSFTAVIALIHEMGHAINEYLQFENESEIQDYNRREEICELYSHSLELMLMDKLDIFYKDPIELRNAQKGLMHRAFNMLLNPLVGDMFQHWLYTNPNHTPEERDEKFLELNKRFTLAPVNITGLEFQMAGSWISSSHYFKYPFYKIEYAMAELGSLQLFEHYRMSPERAIMLYKQGAGTPIGCSIAEFYENTGVRFDFTASTLQQVSQFVKQVIVELR